jgi:hypothetical protein
MSGDLHFVGNIMFMIKALLLFCLIPAALYAACPPGYTEISTDKITVTEGSCAGGTISVDNPRLLPASESACDGAGCYNKTCTYN